MNSTIRAVLAASTVALVLGVTASQAAAHCGTPQAEPTCPTTTVPVTTTVAPTTTTATTVPVTTTTTVPVTEATTTTAAATTTTTAASTTTSTEAAAVTLTALPSTGVGTTTLVLLLIALVLVEAGFLLVSARRIAWLHRLLDEWAPDAPKKADR